MKQTCARLGTSRWTVRKMIDSGELEAIKGSDAPNAPIKVSEESLARYIRRQTIVANTTR
ncbi:helix-turn-helix domain-containing protein [Nonomuraea sp. NBC_01738]|uniref:helix-turn-helix domain-containing protein n=1 Tax=Nonomuraea sp. NBC_01738 TaxID=2976003 RepID=UPI002E1115E0|nr:helix-turn-helix domain-containing protein [Nonomuraea sp. NBC_01738]